MPEFTPPRFQPGDAGFAERVRASFARQTVMGLIGARLGRVAPGEVEIEFPFRPDLCQQHGFFHAGVTCTIADSAAGYAGYSLFPAGCSVLTVVFKISGSEGHSSELQSLMRTSYAVFCLEQQTTSYA